MEVLKVVDGIVASHGAADQIVQYKQLPLDRQQLCGELVLLPVQITNQNPSLIDVVLLGRRGKTRLQPMDDLGIKGPTCRLGGGMDLPMKLWRYPEGCSNEVILFGHTMMLAAGFIVELTSR